ncbi:MAG: LemA family protein [Bacteroidia bacterium]|nr:LemA family protein [Bacteroidia bacterium]MBT8278763.1 LemA family protein [Bacteroidia bacterium]NND24865.1 LemA family protein [Flavobacteriaceae bacterium]NNK60674.1 LemA family protein [Flavobacteriaceae bacterium]NNL33525.1 LemA family protein [Flavobacteriaceae bacterium]
MKKWLPIIIIAIVAVGLYVKGKGFYNGVIVEEENIAEQWSKVESAYQLRNDLIPNLMKVAERYAEYEQETFKSVTDARSKATSIQIDPSNITPEQLQKFKEVQGSMTSALSRLLAVFERYPDLKANENYKELMNSLDRVEKRIKVERDRFNETITPYNNMVRQFPNNIYASIFGFEKKDRFDADEGAEVAPDVNDYKTNK